MYNKVSFATGNGVTGGGSTRITGLGHKNRWNARTARSFFAYTSSINTSEVIFVLYADNVGGHS